MKKFLFLSMILLCTAMSAWSYTTGTVEIINTEDDRGHFFDDRTGIVVTGPEEQETSTCWAVDDRWGLDIRIPFGYVITSVLVYGEVDKIKCDNLIYNYNSEEPSMSDWVQDGTFKYYECINFKAITGWARIAAVRITYHEHKISPNDSWAETCVTAGKKASCTCTDCGHTYYDDVCTSEVEKEEDLILPIDPTKHVLVKRAAVGATDTEDGYTVDHWHCQACGKNFADEDCTEQITENVIIRAKNRDWLCFTANTANSTVELNKVGEPYEAELEYTTTETTWYPYEFGQTITLTDAGDRVFFRNASEDLAKGFSKDLTSNYYQFAMTGSVAASGNVMSLLDKTCLATSFPANGAYCFACLFSGCESLTSAPELPAMTLAQGCYYWMFNGCTGLSSAPELPAMTLAYGCYLAMYDNCTGLKQVPALPATTMETFCYAAMFRGCTSLTEAPELSATTLKDYCYSEMFSGCTSLETAPELPVTTLQQSCYDRMFYGCTSLTTAPELPATTLPYRCYDQMFSGCTKLNQVKVPFTEWTNNTTGNWLNGVASTGTFVCPDALDKSQTGISNIPEGWTPAYEVKANKDPESVNYYSTFYSGTNAYEVPSGVTAYTGVAEGNVLNLTAIESGVIPAKEPVILKASQSQVYLQYTTETGNKSTDNKLSGTDVAKTLGANEYALSLGQNGVGFYLWEGNTIGANKAYLTLPASSAKAFTFQFEDETDGIQNCQLSTVNSQLSTYNLNGMRVGKDYKGIVIVNGKKVYQR